MMLSMGYVWTNQCSKGYKGDLTFDKAQKIVHELKATEGCAKEMRGTSSMESDTIPTFLSGQDWSVLDVDRVKLFRKVSLQEGSVF